MRDRTAVVWFKMRLRHGGEALLLFALIPFATGCAAIAGIADMSLGGDGGVSLIDASGPALGDGGAPPRADATIPLDGGSIGPSSDAATDASPLAADSSLPSDSGASGGDGGGAIVGDAGQSDPVVSVSAGVDHACALTKAGRVLCWGANHMRQLGHSPSLDKTCVAESNSLPCNDVPTLVNDSSAHPLVGVQKILAGPEMTCAVLGDGGIACWGGNAHGLLGHDSSTDPTCYGYRCNGTPTTIAGLVAGSDLAASMFAADVCAIANGRVSCWGSSQDGIYGNGQTCAADASVTETSAPQGSLVAVGATGVALGGWATGCATVAAGGVVCWGRNWAGEGGHNPGTGAPSDQTDPNGANCNGTPQLVTGLMSQVALTSGDAFTCSIGSDSSISCWGYNYFGCLGTGAPDDYMHPAPLTVVGLSAVEISGRARHVCSRSAAGAVSCWGANDFGQAGNGRVGSASGMDAGTACEWGMLCSGQPTLVTSLQVPARSIATGYGTTYAVDSNGGVWAWGLNDFAQLGHLPPNSDVPCDTNLQGFCNGSPTQVAGLPPPM